MSLVPDLLRIPILLELEALGGQDQPAFVIERLVGHFPQLEAERPTLEGLARKVAGQLEREGLLVRTRSRWTLSPRGRQQAQEEGLAQRSLSRAGLERSSSPSSPEVLPSLHRQVQEALQRLGLWLGYAAELEVEHYDVVWKEHPEGERYSHVFEVQVAGNVDSALTRLQQAWRRQRSLPVLVIAELHSGEVAEARLKAAFLELKDVLQMVTAAEVLGLAQSLAPHEGLLAKLGRSRASQA